MQKNKSEGSVIHRPVVPTTGTKPTSFEVGNSQCFKLFTPELLNVISGHCTWILQQCNSKTYFASSETLHISVTLRSPRTYTRHLFWYKKARISFLALVIALYYYIIVRYSNILILTVILLAWWNLVSVRMWIRRTSLVSNSVQLRISSFELVVFITWEISIFVNMI